MEIVGTLFSLNCITKDSLERNETDNNQGRGLNPSPKSTKPKKNPTPASTPKVVQNKITLKINSRPSAKGVVIKEPSPNSTRPTIDEVADKGKEKVVEPPPKVKPISKQAHSSSKAVSARVPFRGEEADFK
ncbi:hypothetical protein Fot_21265 [Forsythia ovata]|uniref:Uncharacterized protein n=1 Tax=Forsythia ovata TaxID=205694 RepID=A0ABD1UUI6_9LAMI